MKNSSLLLSLAMAALICIPSYAETTANQEPTYENETIKIIHQRKSVRNFIEKEVTKEQLETLVKAAMAAPTAINAQPWQFVIVNDKNIKAKYAEGNRQADIIKKASAAIVVCGDMSLGNDMSRKYWDQDCSAATENLLLAAESMGLGALWTGVYPGEERIKNVREQFSIPENVIPLCVILVGYPEGVDKPKDKWKPERIHWNKY